MKEHTTSQDGTDRFPPGQYLTEKWPVLQAGSILRFDFFFSSRRRHTRFDCDWSSDVCSSDLKADYKRPPPRPVENQALVDLGRLLFWDPRVSASGKTACVSCHLPNLGWAVTDPRSRNDSGKLTSRKSPTLIGIGHLRAGVPNGWYGRNATPEAHANASIAAGSMSMRW